MMEMNLDVNLAFSRIDDRTKEQANDLWVLLKPKLPDVLDKFYRHILNFPNMKALFSNPDTLGRAKLAQQSHWGKLFRGRFDADYIASAQRIGGVHHRIGLGPDWYTSGYMVILEEMHRIVIEEASSLIAPGRKWQSVADAICALDRIVLFDLQLVVTVYLSEGRKEYAKQVLAALDNVKTATSEISQGSEDLSQRTERQASALQQTTVVMGNLSETVKLNTSRSDQSRDLAAAALASAQNGVVQVGNVIGAIKGIEEASLRINDIIRVMEEIAFQTKLLALNAAVEAARAGEAGKGFAVVAQEVRSLADRSRMASQQIRELIGNSSTQVGHGVQLVGSAGAALEEIVESVEKVAKIVPEIARASIEQLRGIQEVNSAVTDLDRATQENAALVEENSAAIASLARQTEQLFSLVQSFANS